MEPKLWTKNFTINFAANLFIYFVYYLLVVTTASYAIDILNAKTGEAGLATGIFIFGALIARLAAGRMIKKVGYKKTLYIGLVFYFATSCLYFFVSNLSIFFIVRFFHGIGFGISATGTGSIAAHIIPKERQGEGVSFFGLSMTLASAFGPLIGLYLNQNKTFTYILFLCVALVVISILVSIFIGFKKDKENANKQVAYSKISIHDFFEKKAAPISLMCTLVVIAYTSVLAFLPKFAESTKESSIIENSKIFFLVYSIFVLISRPITGKIYDKKGANIIMYPAFFLFAAGMLLIWLSHNGILLLCAAVLIGLGYGTFFSCANAIALKVSPYERVHLASSTYYIMADLGGGLGPFLLGLLIQTTVSFRELYLVMAVFILCLTVLYYFIYGHKAKREITKLY